MIYIGILILLILLGYVLRTDRREDVANFWLARKILIIILITTTITLTYFLTQKEEIKMPQVKKIPHELEIHQDVRIDNYY